MSWALNTREKLRAGETVRIRPRGNSMTPIIESGQEVALCPVTKETSLVVGDIVLVHVNGRDYLHLINAIRGYQYQIANNHGHINGWATRSSIYGKVTSIGVE